MAIYSIHAKISKQIKNLVYNTINRNSTASLAYDNCMTIRAVTTIEADEAAA